MQNIVDCDVCIGLKVPRATRKENDSHQVDKY